MLKRPRVSQSSFDAGGRRVGGGSVGGPPLSSKRIPSSSLSATKTTSSSSTSTTTTTTSLSSTTTMPRTIVRKPLGTRNDSTDKLFSSKNHSLSVVRAPIMNGLSCGLSASVLQPFRRPKEERRGKQKQADEALRTSSLGMKRRLDGMKRIQERSGKGIHFQPPPKPKYDEDGNTCGETSDEEDEDNADDKPFEPLRVWTSPHNGGEPLGLPPRIVEEVVADEYGIEMTVKSRKPAPLTMYSRNDVFVPPVLGKWLRPHQREGVQFMYECVMGLKPFDGNGCILADDMGLGKTLQSVTLIWTLLKTGITADGEPTAKRVIVVCPCSLVKNWANEFVKWLGPGVVKTLPLAEGDRKEIEKNLDCFGKLKLHNVLICSYECLRTHVKRLTKYKDCCDLLVCDEAHRLKNSDNQTSRALNSLPVKRRVLLTGTPMQNDLQEFYAMVDFTNPGILGTPEEFRKNMLFPILRGREPDATEAQKNKMMKIQEEMSRTVNEFILRRVNTLNAQHLPPKLVQVVCCNLTEIQQNMYQHLITSKDMQHVMEGKQVNCLGSIQMLMKLCNHPSLVADEDPTYGGKAQKPGRRAAASKQIKYTDGEESNFSAPGSDGIAKFLPYSGGGRKVYPEWSGKMFVLYRLMKEMRKPGNGNDKIVIVSNYTQTLDLIGVMCRENSWGFCRLDGSVTMKKRQKMVDEFNDPGSNLIAFLLSSKAGGCGLNLIGGNRLVLFDPDWNPAVDKQAAARCWRDGQKKRCFTYRFLATGTVEEKIFQRQLSKEGLQSVVDDKEQVNALSTKDLRNLFKLRTGTPSDTHDKLRCERCQIIHDNAELEALKVLPMQLAACLDLLDEMVTHEDAQYFLKPLVAEDHGVSKEAYEKIVKQPMDLGTIQNRLKLPSDQASSYKNISSVSKDVNRIFSNVMKVWAPGDDIADAARRLQNWWIEKWTAMVPRLMTMKADQGNDNKENDPLVHDVLEGCATFNNERGDDYQEQIGMPDEENMRHWSHHHTTDTVDDPIFRAALRGTDAVSFVFGLEVTWSLIQQRQQDEDDKKALEVIEEAGEDEFVCTKQLDDKDERTGSDDEASSSDNDEEKGDGMDVDDIPSGQGDTMSECHDNMPAPTHGAVVHGSSPRPDGKCVKDVECTHASSQSDVSVAASQTHSESSSGSTGTGSSQVSPGKSEWECPSCTLFNRQSLRKCDACGTRRPKVGKKRPLEA